MIKEANLHDLILKAAKKEKAVAPSAIPQAEPDLSIDLEEHQLFYQVEALKQQLKESQDTHALRLGYAGKIFGLVCLWLVCVAVAVFFCGFNLFGFHLSDKVLITFITSTTINVVGLFIVVAKWMFPNSNHKVKDGGKDKK